MKSGERRPARGDRGNARQSANTFEESRRWAAARARNGRRTFIVGRKNQRGRLAVVPFDFSDLTWLRGLDLNQRPLGYEGVSFPDPRLGPRFRGASGE